MFWLFALSFVVSLCRRQFSNNLKLCNIILAGNLIPIFFISIWRLLPKSHSFSLGVRPERGIRIRLGYLVFVHTKEHEWLKSSRAFFPCSGDQC